MSFWFDPLSVSAGDIFFPFTARGTTALDMLSANYSMQYANVDRYLCWNDKVCDSNFSNCALLGDPFQAHNTTRLVSFAGMICHNHVAFGTPANGRLVSFDKILHDQRKRNHHRDNFKEQRTSITSNNRRWKTSRLPRLLVLVSSCPVSLGIRNINPKP